MKKSTTNHDAPTLREQFLLAQAAAPHVLEPAEWLTYAETIRGEDHHQLAVENEPEDEAERLRVVQLRQVIEASPTLRDLRTFAVVARAIFPEPEYVVGSGGSHVFIARRDRYEAAQQAKEFLARLTIIYPASVGRVFKDWDESDRASATRRLFMVANLTTAHAKEVEAYNHASAVAEYQRLFPLTGYNHLRTSDYQAWLTDSDAPGVKRSHHVTV